ncbi:MAG: CPBP family intramembrane glutamic endopeptidase [Chloroflexota bacterium]
MSSTAVLINESISTAANILLFAAIPFVWHLLRNRTPKGLLQSLGIYRPRVANPKAVVLLLTVAYLLTLAANVTVIVLGYSGRSPADTQGLTPITLFLVLLLYGMKTGIAEEIFFRGFIARRLIKTLGFARGNLIQAVVFALPHFVLSGPASPVDIGVRIANAFLLGYTFGYVMDRESGGSILPVMAAHTLMNMVSSVVLSLVL